MTPSKKSIHSRVGKRNRRAGKQFERRVAKRIAKAFGWNWQEFCDRAGSGHAQAHDAVTLDNYVSEWPFYWECKYRDQWNYVQLFKSPGTFNPYLWFVECRDSTASDLKPGLAFAKPYCPIMWMTYEDITAEDPDIVAISFQPKHEDRPLYIYLLDDFLRIWK